MLNKISLSFIFSTLLFSSPLFCEIEHQEAILVPSSEQLVWKSAPNFLPAGAQVAIIFGNPQQTGPFTLRLKLPANYVIGPHFHPEDENMTVLSGSVNIGMGEQKIEKNKGLKLSSGSFLHVPKKMVLSLWTDEPAIIQLNNSGPWNLEYSHSEEPKAH